MNIVVLVSHDTGRFLPTYGVETVRTPHTDRLASEGVVVENAFCTAPQCCPARASLFTGLDFNRTGVQGLVGKKYAWRFQPERPHLAARLKEHGYTTAGFGIIHEIGNLGNDPDAWYHEAGFDYLKGREGAERRFGTCIAENFGTWLNEHDASEEGKPFYAQIGIFETHRKYDFIPCKPDDSLGVTIPTPLIDGPATRKDMAELQDYMKYFDDAVGKVLEILDASGHAEDTLFVLTTDHGMEIPRGKGTLYDLGLETLMLVRGPGVAKGKRYPHIHSHTDLVPTILESVGIDKDAEIDGVSHWAGFMDPEHSEAPRAAHYSGKNMHTQYDPMRSVRTEKWKYIRNFENYVPEQCCTDVNSGDLFNEQLPILNRVPNPDEELYDLDTDPGELKNLADDPAFESIRAELEKQLAQYMVQVNDPLLQGPIGTPRFHEVRNHMQGLGSS